MLRIVINIFMLATYGIENKLEIMLKTKWQFWTFE